MKALLLAAGLAVFAWEACVTFAFGMSDDPIEAESKSTRSCLLSVAGLAIAIGAGAWMLFG
jgi:hypothetical protein